MSVTAIKQVGLRSTLAVAVVSAMLSGCGSSSSESSGGGGHGIRRDMLLDLQIDEPLDGGVRFR